MDTGLFDYRLPRSLIAQWPAVERAGSRLLVVPSAGQAAGQGEGSGGGGFRCVGFRQVGEVLRAGDVLVANNTRVVPARLLARKPSGGAVEVLLERVLEVGTARVQLRASKAIRCGQRLVVGGGEELVVTERGDDGLFVVKGECDVAVLFRRCGVMPLPPYIERAAAEADRGRYQTVYAKVEGAVAAPTAGLHFDRALMDALAEAGVDWVEVTLHVGVGTFQPVRVADAEAHRMHKEWVCVDQGVCARIEAARARGGRVVAVGTTVVRALESAARCGRLMPFVGDTELFILPGYRFRVVNALITNFHLPRSTLLMMVCALAGRERVMDAYRYAVARGFRFYSYGDAMWVEAARR